MFALVELNQSKDRTLHKNPIRSLTFHRDLVAVLLHLNDIAEIPDNDDTSAYDNALLTISKVEDPITGSYHWTAQVSGLLSTFLVYEATL